VQNGRILDVFPSATDGNRLVIAVDSSSSEGERFVLRQETFSSDVGWFVQSRVLIEPDQMAGMKAALTCGRMRTADSRPKKAAAKLLPFRIAAAS